MYSFKMDAQREWVCLDVSGTLSVGQADSLSRELHEHAEAARERFGRFRMLADLRSAGSMPADVAARFPQPGEVLKGERERYAVIVETSLAKVNARRWFDDVRFQPFLSANAAETWLAA
jgi:hypothetical protein